MIPGGVFDSSGLKQEIQHLESLSAEPEFWEDREAAEKTMAELKKIKVRIEPWDALLKELENTAALFELAVEENDESLEGEIQGSLDTLAASYEKLKLFELLGEKADPFSAFVTIHPGAGGTESCDWAAMLYRMYGRWAERHGFKITLLDLQEAEGGIKSVDIEINGDYAYGLLKGEGGIHRLVRISPFDSASRRHTSFASVYVSPVFDDDVSEIEVKPEDIRVDTYRASGAGGQHVNKTSSAVRMTHLETGIVVQCQNERSQLKNRSTAMKVLKSRLYEFYRLKQETERAAEAAEKKEIGWGSQIRSYVFHPYTMVKDLRTRHETGNIQAVMDGDLDTFIDAYLRWNNGL
ncbi:MAG: peptide chain release factor 2 [Spirochaeta sp. LUC14_002_19_P3]|nr:MAG: peptide chain release factor 2 [Spirochaeta sp. LUC14_002_19_P3]